MKQNFIHIYDIRAALRSVSGSVDLPNDHMQLVILDIATDTLSRIWMAVWQTNVDVYLAQTQYGYFMFMATRAFSSIIVNF